MSYAEYGQKTIFFQKNKKYLIFFVLKNNIFLTAALYLKLSMTDAQRSHLEQRQFSTLISLLGLRKFKVKVAYYYHHHYNHHHCDHHQLYHHQNYQNTQNYRKNQKN